MHTTLEAFLREAIEEILRRKRSDMMKKNGGERLYLPVSHVWCCEAMRDTWVDGKKWGFSRVEMQRMEDLGVPHQLPFSVPISIKHHLPHSNVLEGDVFYGELAVRADYCGFTDTAKCRESPPPLVATSPHSLTSPHSDSGT
jgi:hypothetical protein